MYLFIQINSIRRRHSIISTSGRDQSAPTHAHYSRRGCASSACTRVRARYINRVCAMSRAAITLVLRPEIQRHRPPISPSPPSYHQTLHQKRLSDTILSTNSVFSGLCFLICRVQNTVTNSIFMLATLL